MTEPDTTDILCGSQLELMRSLGVDMPTDMGSDEAIIKLEDALGEGKAREQARWFLLSVLRHRDGGHWSEPDQSGLSGSELDELASAFLGSVTNRNSMAAVLKNRSYRYGMLEFAKRSNREQMILSMGSKAYQGALKVLPLSPASHGREAPGESGRESGTEPTIAGRRAQRRRAALLAGSVVEGKPSPSQLSRPGMSVEDYEELEKAILTPVDRYWRRRTTHRTPEDRLSLLLGVIAGVMLFLLVWWLILD